MMSNWNRSPNCQMATSTTGMGPLYTMGMPQSKSLLMATGGSCSNNNNNNKLPSTRSFSTIGLGFVGNVLQKLASMLIPTEAQMSTLEKSKQSLSAPDIYVDMCLNTPIFETTQGGKAKLSIPEENETYTCDQTKSLSAGNSPFDWCPIRDELDVMNSNADDEDRPRKRMKPVVKIEASSSTEGKVNSVRKRRTPTSIYPQIKSKTTFCKNRKEKERHNLLVDIMEDFRQISDESDLEEENCDFTPTGSSYEKTQAAIWPIPSSSAPSTKTPLDLCSEKAFPAMFVPVPRPATPRSCTRRLSNTSECDSEDSFVIFAEDVQMTTPSASPAVRKNLCATINKMFIPRRILRNRQISECSDDYIVFCDDSDGAAKNDDCQMFDETDYDSEEEDEEEDSEDETDDESCEEDTNETLSPQPDSGFEEKKVKFNLKPEVHVMRTWDYAYRAARKGEWEMAARDRERFKKRIEETEQILKPVLGSDVRKRVFCERFSLLA